MEIETCFHAMVQLNIVKKIKISDYIVMSIAKKKKNNKTLHYLPGIEYE